MTKILIEVSLDTIIKDLKNVFENNEYKTLFTKIILEIISDYIVANGEISFIDDNGDDITIDFNNEAKGYYVTPDKQGLLYAIIVHKNENDSWFGADFIAIQELIKEEQILRNILISSSNNLTRFFDDTVPLYIS